MHASPFHSSRTSDVPPLERAATHPQMSGSNTPRGSSGKKSSRKASSGSSGTPRNGGSSGGGSNPAFSPSPNPTGSFKATKAKARGSVRQHAATPSPQSTPLANSHEPTRSQLPLANSQLLQLMQEQAKQAALQVGRARPPPSPRSPCTLTARVHVAARVRLVHSIMTRCTRSSYV